MHDWATEDTKSIQQIPDILSKREAKGWEFTQFVTQNDRFVLLFRKVK